jgi:hypothetical protein
MDLRVGCHNGEDDPISGTQAEKRRMSRAELDGRHSFTTSNGIKVHIWERQAKLLARGYYQRRAFGVPLGADRGIAEATLRRLMVDIENGTFVPPSRARRRMFKRDAPSRLTVRQLFNAFLEAKRSDCGRATALDYAARLIPAIEFSERPENRRHWPNAQDCDDEFARAFKTFLHSRSVGRNGHAMAPQRRLSCRQIWNVLSTIANAFNWARDPRVSLLPSHHANPFTPTFIGPKSSKDPLAPIKVPVSLRVQMVQRMDRWQLCTLALPMLLPHRPEEFCGVLINEVIFESHEIVFGDRLGGGDFTKSGTSFRSVWPPELVEMLRALVGGRAAGPLFLSRAAVEGRRRPRKRVESHADLLDLFERQLAGMPRDCIQDAHDRKDVFRQLLRELGAVSEGELRREFKQLLQLVAGEGNGVQLYDLRRSVTTDLKDAGVDVIVRRYVTGHSLRGEILAEYETQDVHRHLQRYFEYSRSLVRAIVSRAADLGVMPAATASTA